MRSIRRRRTRIRRERLRQLLCLQPVCRQHAVVKPTNRTSIEVRRTSKDVWTQVGCVGVLALSALGLAVFLPEQTPAAARLATGLAALGLAGWTVGAGFSLRADFIKLTPSHIETRSLSGVRSRRITDIVGARSGEDGVLLIGREGMPPFHVPLYGRQDADLLAWINALPNLDYQEAVALDDELQSDVRLGSSTAERQTALTRLRRLARGLNWLAIGVMVWGFVFPVPYDVVLIALLSVFGLALGLAMWKRGIITLVPVERIQVSANLFMLVMGPAGVIALRAFLDIQLLDWIEPLAVAVPVTLLVGGLVWKADANLRGLAMVLFFTPILFLGSWGGLVLANARLDSRPPSLVPVRVVDTYQGDRPEVTVILPTQSGSRRMTIQAPRSVVEAAESDQPLCVLIHPGRFGWRYARAVRCRLV